MPNWVYNRLGVSGSPEAIAEFKQKASKSRPESYDEAKKEIVWTNPETEVLSFWNFIAPPQEAVESGEYFGTHGYADGKATGDTKNNWYNFQSREWGTKWDACSAELDEYDTTSLAFRFETAWSPPTPVFHAMVAQHPELDFEIWWEEEQGFGEELETTTTEDEEGKPVKELSITKTWDIPDSHNDYVERDNIDGCRCAWESDPHEWYEDCENREAEMETWHEGNPDEDCDCENRNREEPNLVY